jgi:hypothetical protein
VVADAANVASDKFKEAGPSLTDVLRVLHPPGLICVVSMLIYSIILPESEIFIGL